MQLKRYKFRCYLNRSVCSCHGALRLENVPAYLQVRRVFNYRHPARCAKSGGTVKDGMIRRFLRYPAIDLKAPALFRWPMLLEFFLKNVEDQLPFIVYHQCRAVFPRHQHHAVRDTERSRTDFDFLRQIRPDHFIAFQDP